MILFRLRLVMGMLGLGEQKFELGSGLMDWVQVGVRVRVMVRVRVQKWAVVGSGFWCGLWFGLLSVEGYGIGEG